MRISSRTALKSAGNLEQFSVEFGVPGLDISQDGAAFSTLGNTALVTLNGRALSLGASVTLVNTVINVPVP